MADIGTIVLIGMIVVVLAVMFGSIELYLIFAWAAWLSYFTIIYPLAGRWHFTFARMMQRQTIFGETYMKYCFTRGEC